VGIAGGGGGVECREDDGLPANEEFKSK